MVGAESAITNGGQRVDTNDQSAFFEEVGPGGFFFLEADVTMDRRGFAAMAASRWRAWRGDGPLPSSAGRSGGGDAAVRAGGAEREVSSTLGGSV